MPWEQPEGYRVTSHPTGAASLPVTGQSHKPAFRVRLSPCDAVTTCNGSPVVYHDGLQGRASVKHDPLEDQARTLQATGAYRVLRPIAPIPLETQEPRDQTRVGIFLDLETTGLDPTHDEIIEFGMVPLVYTLDGRSLGTQPAFSRLREPSQPIPVKITTLTGSPLNEFETDRRKSPHPGRATSRFDLRIADSREMSRKRWFFEHDKITPHGPAAPPAGLTIPSSFQRLGCVNESAYRLCAGLHGRPAPRLAA